MKKKLHLGHSPLSNNIYCGHLIENNTCWGANKTDVTIEAISSVVDHVLQFEKREGKKVVLSGGGKKYTIIINTEETSK